MTLPRVNRLVQSLRADLLATGTEVGFGAIPFDDIAGMRKVAGKVQLLDPPAPPGLIERVPVVLVAIRPEEAKDKVKEFDLLKPRGVVILHTDQERRLVVGLVGKKRTAVLGALAHDTYGVRVFRERVEQSGGYHLMILTDNLMGSKSIYALYEFALQGGGMADSEPEW